MPAVFPCHAVSPASRSTLWTICTFSQPTPDSFIAIRSRLSDWSLLQIWTTTDSREPQLHDYTGRAARSRWRQVTVECLRSP